MFLQFTIPGEPTAQGRPRFKNIAGRVITYDPKQSRDYKATVKQYAELAAKKAGWKCTAAPVQVRVTAYMTAAKSKPRKWREDALNNRLFPMKRPDVDNIYKGVADAMSGIIYDDDKQVCSAVVAKCYGEIPHVVVKVATLGAGGTDK